ncbi:MAG: hypothetical protein KJP09_03545 [Bacteroidia bacterium]|nr:hypothetical protein [Bacteroidia bacterium]NND09755.1 hypothetical protein [Flavobacteriaceae bacterium]
MNTVQYLIDKIKSAPELDFGNIFNASIDLFKKSWLQGFLMQIISVLIMIPFFILIYGPIIAAAIAQEGSRGYSDGTWDGIFAGLGILYIAGVIVAILVLGSAVTAIQAAFFVILKKYDHNETVHTNDFFMFLKGPYLGKILGLLAMTILISIPAALLCYLPLIYVLVPLNLFVPFFAFNPHLGVMDIVKVSFSLGNKKWLILFGLIIISSLLAQIVGILACGIGVLFTAAFIYHPVYKVYKQVIGFDDKSSVPINHIVE